MKYLRYPNPTPTLSQSTLLLILPHGVTSSYLPLCCVKISNTPGMSGIREADG